MSIDLAIIDGATRMVLATSDATDVTVRQGPRGCEQVAVRVPLSVAARYDLYARIGRLRMIVTAGGVVLADVRVEDIAITSTGVTLTALGRWRALSDVLYTGFWSSTQYGDWTNDPTSYGVDFAPADRSPRCVLNNDTRLLLMPQKNSAFAQFDGAGLTLRNVSGASTWNQWLSSWQGTLHVLLPVGWEVRLAAFTINRTHLATPIALSGTGALITRSWYLNLPASTDRLMLFIFWANAAPTTYTNETGDFYVLAHGVRVMGLPLTVFVPDDTVSTTLAVNRGAGTSVTATTAAGGTANMYVGMPLVINSGNTPSEQVVVESITSSTQFVATFGASYLAGQTVQGARLRPSTVVYSLHTAIQTANATTLHGSRAQIARCDRDVTEARWEDTAPADIVADLSARGDDTTRWETGVDALRRLYFRPSGAFGQSWYVDVDDLDVQQSLDQLINGVIGRYVDPTGRTTRTTVQSNAASVARFGLSRWGVIDVDSSSGSIAAALAAAATAETADPAPRASMTISRLFTAQGAPAPLWLVQRGDTVTIRNLPAVAATFTDRLRVITVAATELDVIAGTLTITPETPMPDLAYILAAVPQVAEIAASQSSTPQAPPTTIVAAQQVRRSNPPAGGKERSTQK